MFVFIPIMDHCQSSIPNSPSMAQCQILTDDNLFVIDLNNPVNHFNLTQLSNLSYLMEKAVATIKLLVTRHGQTEENSKGIICGQQPGTLTQLGKIQARKIGVSLQKQQLPFDHIYVSDLGRTVATFENIKSQAKYLQKIPTVFTKTLRQKSGGILQGKPLATWKQMADKENKHVRLYKCEKGQSWADVNSRCYAFLRHIVEQHIIKNKNLNEQHQPYIFAVCHGGVMMEFHNMVAMIMQKKNPVFNNTAKNCSFHQFVIEYPLDSQEYKLDHVKIKCIRQNVVDHLKIPL